MSFGSLGAKAIEALNLGAKAGDFYHDTGEGGFSPYHRVHGGDIVSLICASSMPGNFSRTIFACWTICGPAGHAGLVSVMSI